MKKRVTLSLDEDVIMALEAAGGRSLSDTANHALREVTGVMAHRRALVAWLDELDVEHGAPSDADLRAADRLLDEVFGQPGSSSAA